MKVFLYLLVGAIGGVLGGMGMGGGTLLIPLLTIILKVGQHTAQAVNLISFIPMAIISLIIHIKNKLIEKKNALLIIIPGCIFCIAGALLSKSVSNTLLTKLFGGFLVLLACVQFVVKLKKKS